MNPFSSQARSPADFIQEARSLQGSGKVEDAILQLQTAVAYYPSDERINRELIAHFARLERYMDGFRAAVAWYRNDSGNPNCLDTLADLAEVLGEKADAEKWRSQAAAMRPSTGGFGGGGFGGGSFGNGGFGSTGNSAPPSNAFGSFGGFGQAPAAQAKAPTFGNGGGFGAPAAQPAPAFGGFGGGSATPSFGNTNAPAFGNTNAPAFGNFNAKPAQPAFGNNAPAFGNANAPAFGGFGQPAAQGGFGGGQGGFGQAPARAATPAPAPTTPFTFMASASCRTEDDTVRASVVLGQFVNAFREDAGIHLSLVIDGAGERPDYAQVIQQHAESLEKGGNASRITLTFT